MGIFIISLIKDAKIKTFFWTEQHIYWFFCPKCKKTPLCSEYSIKSNNTTPKNTNHRAITNKWLVWKLWRAAALLFFQTTCTTWNNFNNFFGMHPRWVDSVALSGLGMVGCPVAGVSRPYGPLHRLPRFLPSLSGLDHAKARHNKSTGLEPSNRSSPVIRGSLSRQS